MERRPGDKSARTEGSGMARISRRALIGGVASGAAIARPARAATLLRIRELYDVGAEFSPRAQELAGRPVTIPGFMAPPVKPDVRFFVLTKLPMAVCPFCSSETDWPTDIVLVRTRRRQDWVDFSRLIEVTGTLELGTEIDLDTGFVSRVRLTGASYATV